MQPTTPSLLAATPPMGWNSWNSFGAQVRESDILAAAERLVALGLADIGYDTVVIDDGWEAPQRSGGRLAWNTQTFPAGIPALAAQIHEMGLKFGIYSCAGTRTCLGLPSSFGYEEIDALTFAEWGVDFLKYDFCFFPHFLGGRSAYERMGRALRATGRPILFSICNWGMHESTTWARHAGGHLWRTTGDIKDCWHSIYDIGFRKQKDLAHFAGPGGWNDPDMLVVGMCGRGNAEVIAGSEGQGCSDDEYRSHFALWCLQCAPLIIGADLRRIAPRHLDILKQERLIAVNQDPLGLQARMIYYHRNIQVWAKPCADGSVVVGFFNVGSDAESRCPVLFDSLGFPPAIPVSACDVPTGNPLGSFEVFYESGSIPSHGCEVVRLTVA